MPRTNLAVRVAGAEFGIAGEMHRLPAYFDNPAVGTSCWGHRQGRPIYERKLDHSWSCAKKLLRASGGPKYFSSGNINTLEKPVPMLYKRYCDVTLTWRCSDNRWVYLNMCWRTTDVTIKSHLGIDVHNPRALLSPPSFNCWRVLTITWKILDDEINYIYISNDVY